jgi:hypothetical protein
MHPTKRSKILQLKPGCIATPYRVQYDPPLVYICAPFSFTMWRSMSINMRRQKRDSQLVSVDGDWLNDCRVAQRKSTWS